MGKVKYRELHDRLKNEILAGKYADRHILPSEAQLSRRYACSRNTVRNALDELRHEGLIRCRQGKGAFVTKAGSARKIGLLLSGIPYSEYFQPVATAFMQLARDADYELDFGAVRASDPEARIREAEEIVDDFIRGRVAGVIYHPLDYAYDNGAANLRQLEKLTAAGIPVVLFDSDVVVAPARSSYDVVSIDNVIAGETVARHLLDAGARNIHFLLKPNWMPNAWGRIRGVTCAVAATGAVWPPSNILVSEPDDLEAIRRHMRRRPHPDAFVCENDTLAAFFKDSLEKLGWRVPDDVLLAGFDDVSIARLLTPPLTSIHQPCDQIAAAAFTRLLARMANPKLPPQEIFVFAPLVARASSVRPDNRQRSQNRKQERMIRK